MEKARTLVGEVTKFNSQLQVMQDSEVVQLEEGDCVDQGKFVQLSNIRKLDFEYNNLKVLMQVWLEIEKKKMNFNRRKGAWLIFYLFQLIQ